MSEYGTAGFGEEPRPAGRSAEAVERAAEGRGGVAAAARRGDRRGESGGSGCAAGNRGGCACGWVGAGFIAVSDGFHDSPCVPVSGFCLEDGRQGDWPTGGPTHQTAAWRIGRLAQAGKGPGHGFGRARTVRNPESRRLMAISPPFRLGRIRFANTPGNADRAVQ